MSGPESGSERREVERPKPPDEDRVRLLEMRTRELSARALRAERELAAMQASLSWRLTYFLRVGRREVRRLRSERAGAVSRQLRALRRSMTGAFYRTARFARPRVGRIVRAARRHLPGGSREWRTRRQAAQGVDVAARAAALRTELDRATRSWAWRRRVDV